MCSGVATPGALPSSSIPNAARVLPDLRRNACLCATHIAPLIWWDDRPSGMIARGEGGARMRISVHSWRAQDEGHKVSPETQVDKCSALPAVHGLRTELFQDLDYSGKNTKRPGFIALLERARRGDVAIVACYSVSRLSRSVADLYETLQPFPDL